MHRVSLEHMAHLLSSECHTTDTTLCYKTRLCGTVCTTIGVPSLCMELLTRHTPLRTSSPEPCVVTNTTAKHQSHRTIALCGNIPHYINLVGRELQQLLGGGSAVSHMSRAMNLLTNIFHTPTTRMREAQFHVLTVQSITRGDMGNFSSSTCTVTIPLPLLREPHIIHNTTCSTSSQRTEAGSGGISWALPLVEGGETLPSSCFPLLATLDIATWLGRCHCELRPLRCYQNCHSLELLSSARGQRSPAPRGSGTITPLRSYNIYEERSENVLTIHVI